MRDLLLNDITHDLEISQLDLQLVDGIDRVKQHLKIRLLFFYGEWFLDTTAGVKYYDEILVKNPNIAVIDNIIKACIAETPDVIEIIEYESEFNRQQSSLAVTFKVSTVYGELSIEETL